MGILRSKHGGKGELRIGEMGLRFVKWFVAQGFDMMCVRIQLFMENYLPCEDTFDRADGSPVLSITYTCMRTKGWCVPATANSRGPSVTRNSILCKLCRGNQRPCLLLL